MIIHKESILVPTLYNSKTSYYLTTVRFKINYLSLQLDLLYHSHNSATYQVFTSVSKPVLRHSNGIW